MRHRFLSIHKVLSPINYIQGTKMKNVQPKARANQQTNNLNATKIQTITK